MSDALSSDSQRISTVNLVRTSHPWTQADSAAGFVLRYLIPMRRQLVDILGSGSMADDSLKLLLGHLVSAGFGDQKQGRLRDFLLRAIRSAAKTRVADMPEEKRPKLDLDSATLESKTWLGYWRDGLLERAWRSLERHEHADQKVPVYLVLNMATSNPKVSPAMLSKLIKSETGREISEAQINQWLPLARTLFAQFIADEVAETIEGASKDAVKREIIQLGLGSAFAGIQT
jgi:hypothetical protein